MLRLGAMVVRAHQRRLVVDLYARMARMRGLSVLPNAPFNRSTLYRRTQVGVNPLAGICLPARVFERYDFLCFDNTQLKVFVERSR